MLDFAYAANRKFDGPHCGIQMPRRGFAMGHAYKHLFAALAKCCACVVRHKGFGSRLGRCSDMLDFKPF